MIKRNFFIKWYESNGRSFPWREERTTPYQFLVTEVLLQQTKAADVAAVWYKFFAKYPNIISLSKAKKSSLIALIKHLGFGNKRANALKIISSWLVEKHNGAIPENLELLLAIPYIGSYAAHAILCFAFDWKIEIVDANVIRLFSRYFGLELNRDARRAPVSWEIARSLMPRERKKAKEHNYGLLDFTAQICKPGVPLCEICPLKMKCCFGRLKVTVKNTFSDLSR